MDADTAIARQLLELVRAKTGDASATVAEITVLPGHAGQSYSFDLVEPPPTSPRRRYVIRLAPEGVRPVGTADVVRQARIMESLAGTRVPVPPVRWLDEDPRWFGRPFFVVGFVQGDKLALGENQFSAVEQQAYAAMAITTLAALHTVPWEARRNEWGEPFTLRQEMERLDLLLNRPTLEAWTTVGAAELRARLLDSLPPAPQVGCVHGDYQWSNTLFAAGRLQTVIDWELAQIGAVLIDLGWLCLFSDRQSWVDSDLVPPHVPAPEETAERYRAAVQFPVSAADVRWFRAFAGYRFGVITAFNLMLHRRGKRIDPTWEEIARSAPRLFAHGRELLG